MSKYVLITTCVWAGAKQEHEIDGDYDSEEEALEAFGGEENAYQQAIEDHSPEFHIEKVEN